MAARKVRGGSAPKLEELAPAASRSRRYRPDRCRGFAAKAVAGWPLSVEADVFGDGHDVYSAAVEAEARRRSS